MSNNQSIIVVDGETRLIKPKRDEKNKSVTFKEEYYRWETGNTFTFSADLSANDIAEAYKEQRKAAAVK